MNPSYPSLFESLEPRLAPAGVVMLSTAGGVLTMTGDNLNNSVQVTNIAPGQWEVTDHMGDGTMFTYAGAPAAASVTLFATQSIKATLNGGSDQIQLKDLQVNGSVNVLGNDGDDNVIFDNVTVNGLTTVDAGNGIDSISASGAFNGLVTLKTGKGADAVAIGEAFLGKGLTVDLGTESNTFNITAGSLQSYGAISVLAAGSAVDTQAYGVDTTSGYIAGNLSFKTSAGTTNLTLGGAVANDSLQVTGNLTAQTAAGNDRITLQQNLLVGGALGITAGDGTNEVVSTDLANFKLGSLTYTGGKGADTFALKGDIGAIGGNVALNGGAGVNQFDIATATSLRIGGGVSYTGGAADDTLNLSGAATKVGGQLLFKGADGNNTLDVKVLSGSLGSVNYSGGKDGDGLALGDFTNLTTLLTVQGGVTASMGANGGRVDVRDTLIYGGLNVTSANAQGLEFVNVTESTVLGTSSLKMDGAADATITFNDVTFQSALSISTGGGSDRVNFDTDEVETAAISVFNTTVKINLGTGDDFFNAGTVNMIATVGNQFAGLELDGGTGSDTADFEPAAFQNLFINQPVLKGIEIKA